MVRLWGRAGGSPLEDPALGPDVQAGLIFVLGFEAIFFFGGIRFNFDMGGGSWARSAASVATVQGAWWQGERNRACRRYGVMVRPP